jgi:tRNA G18 (ribose-2'-O)-methylase SpoU
MDFIELSDTDDERLRVYSDMRDVLLRSYPGTPNGLFIAESAKVAGRALDAGVKPVSVLVEQHWVEQTRELVDRMREANPELPVFLSTSEQFKDITGYAIVRGALPAFEPPDLPALADVLEGAKRVAVLEDITNYTNIGAIFRSAAALGIDAVLITPSCHDPYYRRAARVSMGTVFQVPWTRIGEKQDWAHTGIEQLHELGFKVAALALSDDSIPLDAPELKQNDKLALVLGTEGDGLAHSTIANCDYVVRIPMSHNVDSLNVAAASAVAFWELRTR